MPNFPISREKAIELLKKYNSDEKNFIHYFESEAIMKELALKLGENAEYWAMLGLLHDIDWEITKQNIVEHLTKAPEILKNASFDKEFIEIVLSHGYSFEELPKLKDKKRTKKVEYALAASETLTGLIHAYALMREGKISDMDAKGLMKKYKDKRFAAGCDREIIKEIENLGISLEDFFGIGIEGIKKIKGVIGLR
ncbi:MAG: HDIG domain-containing metalloprotein [Nanoarchaeota archaeon]